MFVVVHCESSHAHDSTSEAGPATGQSWSLGGGCPVHPGTNFLVPLDIELSVDRKDEFGDDLLLRTDRAANVHILGGIIEVAENLKRLRSIERNRSSDGGEHRACLTAQESLPLASLYGILTKWSGAQARLWSYTADSRVLTIHLEAEEREDNLHIVVSDTEYVELPHIWWNSQLRFSVERDDRHGRELIILFDQQANVRILGSRVDARENVEPLMKFIFPRDKPWKR